MVNGEVGVIETLEALGREHGVLRRRDLVGVHLSHAWLDHLEERVLKLGPGLYGLRGSGPYPYPLQACVRVPKGVLCLKSALHLHGLIPWPSEVWMALPHKAHVPRVLHPPMRFIRTTPRFHAADVQTLAAGRSSVCVYSLERTLIDCIRHQVKLDPAWVRSVWRTAISREPALGDRVQALAHLRHARAPVRRFLEDVSLLAA